MEFDTTLKIHETSCINGNILVYLLYSEKDIFVFFYDQYHSHITCAPGPLTPLQHSLWLSGCSFSPGTYTCLPSACTDIQSLRLINTGA